MRLRLAGWLWKYSFKHLLLERKWADNFGTVLKFTCIGMAFVWKFYFRVNGRFGILLMWLFLRYIICVLQAYFIFGIYFNGLFFCFTLDTTHRKVGKGTWKPGNIMLKNFVPIKTLPCPTFLQINFIIFYIS